MTNDIHHLIAPCGIYCVACPKYRDRNLCRGCRVDSRHNNCDIYECCVSIGALTYCHECDCFPCERLQDFISFNAGKNFAHFRHVAIENLIHMRDVGVEKWVEEMNKKVLTGEYRINCKCDNGRLDHSPCPCKK